MAKAIESFLFGLFFGMGFCLAFGVLRIIAGLLNKAVAFPWM